MKKAKKVITLLAAISTLSASLTAINTNAITLLFEEGSEVYNKYLEGFTPIEDNEKFFSVFAGESFAFADDTDYQVYVKAFDDENGSEVYAYKIAIALDNYMYVQVKDSEFIPEITQIIESFGYTDVSLQTDLNEKFYISENWEENISVETAEALCNELKSKDLISSFNYNGNLITFSQPQFDYSITGYDTETQLTDVTILEDYIAENNLDFSVVEMTEENKYCAVPNYQITAEEHLEIAKQIYADLGIYPYWLVPANTTETYYGNSIDMFNSDSVSTILGDVNLDGEVSIADAVGIMAYVSNPENNQLNEQQIANGDIHEPGNGLNANDALKLQQYLAGITEL